MTKKQRHKKVPEWECGTAMPKMMKNKENEEQQYQ